MLFSPVWIVFLVAGLLFVNLLRQFLPRRKEEPPFVFHWLPIIGNSISYGIDPYKFFVRCREKYGDIFTFVLFGKKITCYFGVEGNDFVLNSKHSEVSAEEIYGPLTTPVFGRNVVYDCPNSKFMEQKKFVKFGLSTAALKTYVPLISQEVLDYIETGSSFQGASGVVDVTKAMSELTLVSAARSLQGEEVRQKLIYEMADLYHDLDLGFQPINFLIPWAPLPHNRKRDAAHAKMNAIYANIIRARRLGGVELGRDMIWNLMGCTYKDGTPVPDEEIANMMITLLMAGQHTSASSTSWIIFHLAAHPEIMEELYQEQLHALGQGGRLPPLEFDHVEKLTLLKNVVKETLRCHSSIHSVMRKVKKPMHVPGTDYIITPDKVLLASPLVTALDEEHFRNAGKWDPHRWDAIVDEDDPDADTTDPKAVCKGTRSPYLPFGAGRHRCIGEKFAYVNLGAIISTLVREFRFSTMDGTREVPKTDYACLFSRPEQPAVVRWERRSQKQEAA